MNEDSLKQQKVEALLEKYIRTSPASAMPEYNSESKSELTDEDLELLNMLQISRKNEDSNFNFETIYYQEQEYQNTKPHNVSPIRDDLGRSNAEVRNLKMKLKVANESLAKSTAEISQLRSDLVKMKNFKTNVQTAQKSSDTIVKKLKSQEKKTDEVTETTKSETYVK
jgi:hypothetical protein